MSALVRLERFLTDRHRRLRSAALLRIGLGIAGVHIYVSNYADRTLLWGPNGLLPLQTRQRHGLPESIPSMYEVTDSTFWFDVVFHAGLLAAVAYTILGGRGLAMVHAVMLWSLYDANGFILDGGDNLARILAVWSCFLVTDAYWSPRSRQRQRRLDIDPASVRSYLPRIAHNAAASVIVFQVMVVYTVAGSWKLAGDPWRSGTALYYISRVDEFSFSPALEAVTTNPFLVTVLSYATVASQLAFAPCVLLGGRARRLAVAAVLGMHVSIGFSMGLVGFALTMIAADLICLSDRDHEWVGERVRSLTRVLWRRPVSPVRVETATSQPQHA